MSDASLRAEGGGRWFAWDPLWNTCPEFEMDHFRLLFSKILGMVTAPGQVNRHHRPRENKCCVYASAIMWIILYGAPIRAQIVANDRHIYRSCGPQLQRRLSLRTIRTSRAAKRQPFLRGCCLFASCPTSWGVRICGNVRLYVRTVSSYLGIEHLREKSDVAL